MMLDRLTTPHGPAHEARGVALHAADMAKLDLRRSLCRHRTYHCTDHHFLRGQAVSEKLRALLEPYVLPFLLVLLGALARRAYDVRDGRTPRFFDATLPLDLLMMLPGVIIGAAVNEQLGLAGNSAAAIMVITGYAGWRAIMVWFAKSKGIDVDLGGEKKP